MLTEIDGVDDNEDEDETRTFNRVDAPFVTDVMSIVKMAGLALSYIAKELQLTGFIILIWTCELKRCPYRNPTRDHGRTLQCCNFCNILLMV